jgi:hypothetical protein
METLPDEVLIKEILERCTTEQRFVRICQSNELWRLPPTSILSGLQWFLGVSTTSPRSTTWRLVSEFHPTSESEPESRNYSLSSLPAYLPQGVNLGSNPDIFGSSGNPSPLAFQLVIKKPLPSCPLKERGDKNCFSFELLH